MVCVVTRHQTGSSPPTYVNYPPFIYFFLHTQLCLHGRPRSITEKFHRGKAPGFGGAVYYCRFESKSKKFFFAGAFNVANVYYNIFGVLSKECLIFLECSNVSTVLTRICENAWRFQREKCMLNINMSRCWSLFCCKLFTQNVHQMCALLLHFCTEYNASHAIQTGRFYSLKFSPWNWNYWCRAILGLTPFFDLWNKNLHQFS